MVYFPGKEVSALKHIKPILAILLCLCLWACAAPAGETTAPIPTETTAPPTLPLGERISDTWYTAIDCSSFCNDYILQTMGQELAHHFDFTGITVAGVLTLREDGTFTMTITQEAVDAYTREIDRIMQENLHSYLEAWLGDKLTDRTLDQYLRAANITMEDLLIAAGVNIPQMTQDLLDPLRAVPCSGTYYRQDGLLHIAGTVCAYTLTETSLTVSAPEDAAGLAAFPALFPLDFTR